MTKKLFAVLIVSLLSIAATETVHDNKTEYAGINTGMKFAQFTNMFPALEEFIKGRYLELEQRSETDISILLKRPDGMELFDRYLKKMPVRVFKGEFKCDSPVMAYFVVYPASPSGSKREELYSYDYLACAGTEEIPATRVVDKYIEKYGNYDKKDYDRDQPIYKKVKGRYEVRIKPVNTATGEPGIVITITDELVFKKNYDGWRGWLRDIEESVKDKF